MPCDRLIAGDYTEGRYGVLSDPDPKSITIELGNLPSSFIVTQCDGVTVWQGGRFGDGEQRHYEASGTSLAATTDTDSSVLLHIPSALPAPPDLLLLHEAQHRSRNLVSLVVSLAHQSLSSIENDPVVHAFVERLRSLDAVARIGCEVEGDLCPVARIADQVTQRLDDPLRPRIVKTGPDVAIAARWAHLLAIVLHELTVNALRHGSLSIAQGRVDMRWAIARDASDPLDTLLFSWRERDGPPVPKQTRTGFGTRVLRDLIKSNRRCEAVLKMLPTGLVYELSIAFGDGELRY